MDPQIDNISNMDIVVTLLCVIVVSYIFVSYYYFQTQHIDAWMLLFALFFLVVYYLSKRTSTKESFTDAQKINNTATPVYKVEDDVSDIKDVTSVYLTAFNNKSYSGSGLTWMSIASPSSIKNACSTDSYKFAFAKDPQYSRANGFNTDKNVITGPLACSLGIEFSGSFSIMFGFRMKSMASAKDDVELIQLKANSSNNNGLSIFIPAASIRDSYGQFMTCKLQVMVGTSSFTASFQGGQNVPFEYNSLYLMFLVKSRDTIKMMYMKNDNSAIVQILDAKGSFSGTNFSNSPMIINRKGTWQADLFNFAIFNVALDESNIHTMYNKAMDTYFQNTDQRYQSVALQRDDYRKQLDALKACPYNDDTCKSCQDVKDWRNPIGVVGSSSESCKKAINSYCALNTKDALCGGCYDSHNINYNNDVCRMTRNILSNPSGFYKSLYDEMSNTDIDYVKSKYSLIANADCTKPTAAPVQTASTSVPSATPNTQTDEVKNFYKEGSSTIPAGEPIYLPDSTGSSGGFFSSFSKWFS